jgi:GT2 family glycosyltransferase
MNPAHVLPDHDIAVVIVNYNSAEMSLNAMQSIFDKTTDTNSIHIHVVDNASPDDCATVLRKEISGRGWASQTTLYEETTNHGFGRGETMSP